MSLGQQPRGSASSSWAGGRARWRRETRRSCARDGVLGRGRRGCKGIPGACWAPQVRAGPRDPVTALVARCGASPSGVHASSLSRAKSRVPLSAQAPAAGSSSWRRPKQDHVFVPAAPMIHSFNRLSRVLGQKGRPRGGSPLATFLPAFFLLLEGGNRRGSCLFSA